MKSKHDDYYELSYYTLAHPDPQFIHQYIVDAYAAQTADARTRPIAVIFALIGLYLHLERGLSGAEVQRMHMRLARTRKQWPAIPLPVERGSVSVSDVVRVSPGPERDAAIEAWCESVWKAYTGSRDTIIELVRSELR